MNFILDLLVTSVQQLWGSLLHNWPYLLVGVAISALLKVYVDSEKISAFLTRFRGLGVVAATGIAVGTPLCSCGTTAVILGMMASTMPWVPIVAFMVSSPLSSPEGLIFSAGLFGWPFALAFFISSILLGLVGGGAAALLESRGWLANQTRYTTPVKTAAASTCGCGPGEKVYQSDTRQVRLEQLQPAAACGCGTGDAVLAAQNVTTGLCGCGEPEPEPEQECSCAQPAAPTQARPERKTKFADFFRELYASGRQLLPMFIGFSFIGFVLNGLIPEGWISSIFGSGKVYSVPLAATLGLPLYINMEGALPLIRSLLDAGMSQGAALAFMIAGAGTSIGAIGGALTIARWRVVGLVVFVLWIGAILTGFGYDLLLALNLF